MVYRIMIDHQGPLSCRELADLTRLTHGQVYYRLRQLRQWGLVRMKGKQWSVTEILTAEELDERVARPAGRLERGERRRRRAVRDRQLYALEQVLSAFRPRRSRHP
jgi:hypothetical protein